MKTLFNLRCFLATFALSTLAISAQAQIVGSQHDMTTGGNAQGSGASDQVCVYCHTPHGSDSSASAPLWNKVFTAGPFTRYSSLNTTTFDSNEAPVGSVSLACLSCHDGTQAMDVVINSPGSGGWNPAGSSIGGLGVMTGAPVPMLETDLTNDHPISMQYAAGGPVDTDTDGLFAGTLGDPDFNAPFKATVNGQPIWWVDSAVGTTGTREKTDMLLYTRNDGIGSGGTVEPFVECGSCHDPHNSSTQSATQVAFLRITNTASQVCTACHDK
jgi:predicted CXXCH cytochrome family protein